ncbi:uncharacterized protein I303_102085 [Kwoniella dejecticola CBS 10117]|uniref:Uncharacterized protein n=1 Tax=Kwoniella dejecticola CBS 10117 TaxID=1296121 RepID=A0A1A6ABX1_9TREE|nr:uncharacterized protein I303_01774 [Kwoniella dejecticola CBS 10117]OBR87566.1 hypothetical protein I303_01774 [Kwoniella dejecticola CBS 10117]
MVFGNSIPLSSDEEEAEKDEVLNYWANPNSAIRYQSDGKRLPVGCMMPTSAPQSKRFSAQERKLADAGYYGWRTQPYDDVFKDDDEMSVGAKSQKTDTSSQSEILTTVSTVPEEPVSAPAINTDDRTTIITTPSVPDPAITSAGDSATTSRWTELPCIVTRSDSSDLS